MLVQTFPFKCAPCAMGYHAACLGEHCPCSEPEAARHPKRVPWHIQPRSTIGDAFNRASGGG